MSSDLHPERIQYLLERYAAGVCSHAELLELMEALREGGQEAELEKVMDGMWSREAGEIPPGVDRERVFSQIRPRRRVLRAIGLSAAAAAVLGIGVFLYLKQEKEAPVAVRMEPKTETKKMDIAPGGNRAILTLGDGRNLVLDSAKEGRLTSEVTKTGSGALAYLPGGEGPVSYNKISTPKGGRYMVTLPDGSRVWLNAASSLRFPTAFKGDDRTVELTGEAYFEIEKDKRRPFYVQTERMKVAVLGTSFNVMAYEEEGMVRTTLLDGAVRVSGETGKDVLLSPGQQAQYLKEGKLKVLNDVSTEEAMAWKDDLFYFKGTDIQTIMRQLARWYDIDVRYDGFVGGKFYAKIPRNTNLSIVLRALALTNKLNFSQQGKKVTVTP